MLIPPTIHDVYEAQRLVRRFLPPTPFHPSTPLSHTLGCEAFVKYENLTPIGAFKVRGGLNLIASLSAAERARGVITASTGNHGQSIAYAARAFGVRAIVAAPQGANPDKVQAMRSLGAEVALHGRDFDEARLWAEAKAAEEGYRYIHAANEPLLIAGVGTVSLEIMEELPEVETILVPIGGGSGVCGHLIVAKAINPKVQVIGVQAEKAPAVCLSWKSGRMVETDSAATFAEGLATRVPFELTLGIISRLIDDIVLVSEEELRQAILLLLATTHQLAEGAGAAATAGALKIKERLRGRKVALILSGGNITLDTLRRALTDEGPWQ